MRDFLIIALVGAVAGHVGNPALAIALFVGTIGAVLVMRAHHPKRNGITTELAAVATFALAAPMPYGRPSIRRRTGNRARCHSRGAR